MVTRLIVAMSGPDAQSLERDCQSKSNQILELENSIKKVNPAATLFMAQKVNVAQATLQTKEDWTSQTEGGPLIDGWKFER